MGGARFTRRRFLYGLAALAFALFWFSADYVVDKTDQWCLRCGRIRHAEIARIGRLVTLSERETSSRPTPWSTLHERLAGRCAAHAWKSFHGRLDGPCIRANYSGYRPPQIGWDEESLAFLAGSAPVLLAEVVAVVDRISAGLSPSTLPSPEASGRLHRIDGMFEEHLGSRDPEAWKAAWEKIRGGL